MFSKSKKIEWIERKAEIERDINEEYGQRIIKDINDVDRRLGLSYNEKLSELKSSMKYCNAICLIDEFYQVQFEEWFKRIAQKELLSDRMIKIITMKQKEKWMSMRNWRNRNNKK